MAWFHGTRFLPLYEPDNPIQANGHPNPALDTGSPCQGTGGSRRSSELFFVLVNLAHVH